MKLGLYLKPDTKLRWIIKLGENCKESRRKHKEISLEEAKIC